MKISFVQSIYTLFYAFDHFFFKKKKSKFIQIACITVVLTILSISCYSADYYVSNNGSDSNPGTSPELAWRSLGRVNSFNPSPGDKILFKRGDEWVGTIIVKSSGTLGNPIVYGAYDSGEKPKISGSKEVTGWRQHTGNIYKANVTASEINQVFIDNKRLRSARHPNKGYFTIKQVSSPRSFSSNEISGQINYAGASALIRAREWSISTIPVIRSSGQSLTLSSAPIYDVNVNEGFVLFNKLDFLDQPGEWFFDVNSNMLYVWTPGGDSPANYTVSASVEKNAVFAAKKNHIVIENLKLHRTNGDAVLLNNCRYLTVQNNEITWPGSKGISLSSKASNNCVISNNFINGASFEGIHLKGQAHTVTDNIVKNIYIFENFGVSGGGAPMGGRGIYISHGSNNIIKHNKLDSIGYNGIQMFNAPHTKIENNVIKNSCLTKEDGGGIYCFNSEENHPGCEYSVIRGNIVDKVVGNGDGYTEKIRLGTGIYIDDRIHHITVENNTVTDCSLQGIFLHNNKHVTVKNNIIFNNGSGYRVTEKYNAKENIVKNNTIVNTASSHYTGEDAMLGMLNSGKKHIVTIDENIYVDHHRDKPFNDTKNFSMNSFSEWQALTGYDKSSIFKGGELEEDEKEHLFYNGTKQTTTIELGNAIYRDVLGNAVSGAIILEPFESIILIGKELEKINQSPVINEQSFIISSPTSENDFIGQIVASDMDENQQLFYSIAEGNINQIFNLNPSTGELYVQKKFDSGTNELFQLKVNVTDDAANPITASAIVNVHFNIAEQDTNTDNQPPVIHSFKIPTVSSSLTVPLEELDVSDNRSVTGFFFSLSPETPKLNHLSWFSSPLPRLKFSEAGEKTIYVWIKDAAGNISKPAYATVNVISDGNEFILNDSTEHISICEGEEYLGWTESGEYQRTINITTDTIQEITTYLTVNTVVYTTENITIDEGENYKGWTESGIYQRTVTSSGGCDSIITTNLSVIHIDEISENISICEGEDYLGWMESGEYHREEVVDLDTIRQITTNLTVNPVQHITEEITINKGEDYNGWTESGEYERVLMASTGCDSIVTTVLTVSEINTHSENYLADNHQKLYPNPAGNYIFVDYAFEPNEATLIQLFDLNGKKLVTIKPVSEQNKIMLNHLPSGIYYLKSISHNRQ
ncbi:MAG: right-handed parallel beta-helix repeat-containing protein, partial [Bacteroidota bacterium]